MAQRHKRLPREELVKLLDRGLTRVKIIRATGVDGGSLNTLIREYGLLGYKAGKRNAVPMLTDPTPAPSLPPPPLPKLSVTAEHAISIIPNAVDLKVTQITFNGGPALMVEPIYADA